MRKIYLILWFLLLNTLVIGQVVTPESRFLKDNWKASWISCPGISQRAYGVYHFRKTFPLAQKPEKFIIHVTADNRYRLFVNGNAVCTGPARSDLAHWNYETVDIASYLQKGNNLIAALVWNMGEHAAVAQISNQTGFLLQADTKENEFANTNPGWKVIHDTAYQPCSLDNGQRLRAYMVVGPGDKLTAGNYPWGWEQLQYDDSKWLNVVKISAAAPTGYGTDNLWTLVPRSIPLMEETLQRITVIRRSSGIEASTAFLKGEQKLVIPAHKTVSILLDQTFNTVAYPELNVSNGKDATVRLSYAEALVNKNGQKGNRDETDGKELRGNYDIFIADGGTNRVFRPLWMRCFRYLQLDITTHDEPLEINDLVGKYTGYPFKKVAEFTSNDASMQELWNTAWRTARLCAGETYFDCPYYEQLQYEGDTRIQALISLYVTGDDRLMRKAIEDFYNSRVAEGLTQGRYPSNRLQVIPTYSLFWVSMIYDYWMHRKDDRFIRQYLTAIQSILEWYENRIDLQKNMLGPMEWWSFTDYTNVFESGVPEGAQNGNSSIITLQYAYTLKQAAEIYAYFDKKNEREHCMLLANQLNKGTYQNCYDQENGWIANTPEKKSFSQHAGIMAILSGALSGKDVSVTALKMINDLTLGQATFYFRFYLNQALKKAGMADLYYGQLTPWRDMLKIGLTTFAEKPEPARSDCHAWSASPLYDFLATICGIVPDAPGFQKVLIQPALGELQEVNAKMPHPLGMIAVSLKRVGKDGVTGVVTLPSGLTGSFVWNGKVVPLKGGSQIINL